MSLRADGYKPAMVKGTGDSAVKGAMQAWWDWCYTRDDLSIVEGNLFAAWGGTFVEWSAALAAWFDAAGSYTGAEEVALYAAVAGLAPDEFEGLSVLMTDPPENERKAQPLPLPDEAITVAQMVAIAPELVSPRGAFKVATKKANAVAFKLHKGRTIGEQNWTPPMVVASKAAEIRIAAPPLAGYVMFG